MTAYAKTQTAALEGARVEARFYLETLNLVERLHRQLLDVIKDELDRRDEREINSVQALLLFNVGDQELTAGELRTRGHYLGSNVSYNLKKLVESGYIQLASSLRQSGIECLDLTPILSGQAAALLASGQYNFHDDDTHWNASGAALAAHAIAAALNPTGP